jgi:hypothetical protein
MNKTADKAKYIREYMREYRKRNPDKVKEANRRSYLKHHERRKADMREAYQAGKWSKHLTRKYGISREQYDAMLLAQGGKCALCTTSEAGGRGNRFHVDHCHERGNVRQLLCNACNHMLGCARDKPDVLRAAAAYLERHAESVLTRNEKSS